MRFALASLLAALIIGPWTGCNREPVAPPAAPPTERAPVRTLPAEAPHGPILLVAARRFG
jgi:hypothetical protein